jgi:SPP1 family phage portal protein
MNIVKAYRNFKNVYELVSNRSKERDDLLNKIDEWRGSKLREEQIIGKNYFNGYHDILNRKMTALDENNKCIELKGVPNNKIINNVYAKAVNQKVNYLLGNAIQFNIDDNEQYLNKLKEFVNESNLDDILKDLYRDSLNCGIAWLYAFIDNESNLRFSIFKPYEVLAVWDDNMHTKLNKIIRVYDVPNLNQFTTRIEVYGKDGIEFYLANADTLISDPTRQPTNYITLDLNNGEQRYFNFNRIPVIPFKYNNDEIPLIRRAKSLQDAMNEMLSDMQNDIQQNPHNSTLHLHNVAFADNPAQIRNTINTWNMIITEDGINGGNAQVEMLKTDFDVNKYKEMNKIYKDAIVENTMSFDFKNNQTYGMMNEMNIKSIYMDVDLDADNTEMQFGRSLVYLINNFINPYLGYPNIKITRKMIQFNRDVLFNESQRIDDCNKAAMLLSRETILKNHPLVDDVSKELQRKAYELQIDQEMQSDSAKAKMNLIKKNQTDELSGVNNSTGESKEKK